MPRRSWVWDPKRKELVEIDPNFIPEQRAPMVIGDLPGYQSPVTGLWVEGRKQRRDDLKRSDSRPWEGLQQERKEAARRAAYAEQRSETRLERGMHEIYHQMPAAHRRAIEGR